MGQETLSRFAAREHRGPEQPGGTGLGQTDVLPYRLLAPAASYPERLPLVLLLHGAGERGTDNAAQLRNGTAELLGTAEAQHRFPCYFVLPQCPPGSRWVEVDWGAHHHELPRSPSRPMGLVLELVPRLIAELPVDPERVYAIGLSMGGYGVWDLLSRRPELFAGAVAICGGGDESQAERIAPVPLWVFHGSDDAVVPVERSRRMVAALRQAGAAPRYSELPGVGHDSWTSAFHEPELLPWLFTQRLRP